MIPYRLYFVGIQLLLLAYTAQPFVLLTANMEDIKKIARKFVSDSLADKIADLVVQATAQITERTPNVSEENDLNLMYDENNLRSPTRQRIEMTETTKRYKEQKHQQRSTPTSNILRGAGRVEAKLKYRQKPRNEISEDIPSTEDRHKYSNKISQREEVKQKYRPDKYREREHKYKETAQPKYVNKHLSIPKYKTTEKHGLIKLSAVDSGELNDFKSEYDRKTTEDEMETTRFRGLRALGRVEFTTRKEKTDFDQYDNPKYPRAEYIATSGPVMLPRMPIQKEDEISQRGKELTTTNATEI